jgi:hypothetical protein
MARISAMVQVGGKHKAGKPEYLSGGIIRACLVRVGGAYCRA